MRAASTASIVPLAQARSEPRLASVKLGMGKGEAAVGLMYLDGRVCVEWTMSDDERERIMRGENVRLWMWTDRREAPAIHMEVTSEQKP